MRAPVCPAVIAALGISAVMHAQPLDRLSGKVMPAQGPGANLDVHVEAIFGFAGGDFLGQRTFTARTGAKGDWALLAFKAGVWLFDAEAPSHLPDAIALPFNLVSPPGSGVGGLTPSWHPILRPAAMPSGDAGQLLADALSAVRSGRSDRATPLLARLADTSDVAALVGAGRICLLMKDATVARPFFRRAAEKDPGSFAAAVGMGSSALMQRDVDSAAKAFDAARKLATDKDERGYLAAAINELNKAHNVMRGTY
jgi:cellobiose-specific phosphotransferase system component IIA